MGAADTTRRRAMGRGAKARQQTRTLYVYDIPKYMFPFLPKLFRGSRQSIVASSPPAAAVSSLTARI